MKYTPSGVTTVNVPIASRPFLGGEFVVKYTFTEAVLLATITLTGATSGTLVAEPGTALPASPGADLAMVLLNPLRSAGADLSVGISAKGATTSTLIGAASFATPDWLRDQTANQPLGTAADVATASDEKFVTGAPGLAIGTISGGVAGTKLGLYMLPAAADWTLIGCTGAVRVSDKSRKPKNIACGLNQSAFVKPGVTEIGTVSISAKVRSFLEGLARIRGQRVTLMLEGTKEDSVLTDRIVLTSAILTSPVDLPEGDGEVMVSAEGQYEDALFFGAPSAA